MTTVVQFKPAPVAQPTAAHHHRLRVASRALSWLFTGLLILVGALSAVLIAGIVVYPGDDYRIGSNAVWIGTGSADSVAFHTLSLPHRLAYAAVGVVRMAPSLMIFWRLRELFALYGQGEVFGRRNGWLIGQVGVWLCVYAISPFLCHLFLSATGWEIDKNWAHLSSIQAFILGLLVFVIAQVMQVGREIEEDREAFV
ncbi:DUF2975 domain-containing protein [Caulobacter sp. NIBR2454]|uniref:DUF2975 domain-containing protein n=1 Tax=Caulobacter sp. NIBR2454 TaxID=3015996 RepID=UPI0022B703F2|nr:DUF2975 domain-containing protein [Caulobacter sp. NIBR2454]